MTRPAGILWILVIVAAAFSLYVVKYQVQSVIARVAETSRQLEDEKAALHVAAAEWAYLNRPQRLRALAARYLSDSNLTASQFADIKAIPFPAETQADAGHEGGVRPVAMKTAK
ncbi:MAG: cell division protein FtsL [Pseudomonadota bacterium]|nr:cell division protein FtsL [Pseudomonadota bacterium]MDE3037437.1 cell division protein FtsL [Pseudomonadota bacterium]